MSSLVEAEKAQSGDEGDVTGRSAQGARPPEANR